MNNEFPDIRDESSGIIYESPDIVYESALEVRAGSPGGPGGGRFPFPWDF
jgi:hypothetical protein